MNVKKSLLNFRNFVVFGSFFEAIPFDENDEKQKERILPDIPLEVELDILTDPDDKNLYNIVLEVSGNRSEKKLPGYSFSIACEGIFSIDNQEQLEKDKIDQLLLYSAVPMVISSLRGYLANISSYSIYGQYLLPSIDLQDLIKKKVKVQKTDKKPS